MKDTWPRVTTRWARIAEVPYLAQRLAQDPRYEKVDLEESIVRVVEYGDQLVGFGAAHLSWRIEPLFLFPEFMKDAPRVARMRATLLLTQDLDRYVMGDEIDGIRNETGIHRFFCFMVNRVMQKLALSYGLIPAYVGGKFFGRRIFGRE